MYYKNKQGIYKITNVINNKMYIGQSINLHKRFTEHVYSVGYESTKKRYLYRAINKYGIENFTVEVIEECSIEDKEELKNYLDEREVYYIKYYKSEVDGYNCTSGGDINPSYNQGVVRKRTYILLNNKEVNEKLRLKGENNPRARLTDEMVIDIRNRYSKGEPRKEIYKDYEKNVGYGAFQYAMYGKTWRHLKPPTKPNKRGEKLTSSKVYAMRELYREGKMVKDIADMYNISSKHASRVLNLGRWRDEESIPENYIEFIEKRKNK